MTIKAIIFDLGGVLLRTADFAPREQLAAQLGMSRGELEELIFGGASGGGVQTGEISVEQHLEYVRSRLNFSREDFKKMVDKFFAEDGLDQGMLDYVRYLHKTYKTALLSNSAPDLRKRIEENWHFADAFDMMIISGEEGVAKPDPRIYELALARLGVPADESVFVDDMPENVKGARDVGMQAIQFRSPQQAREEIDQLIRKS